MTAQIKIQEIIKKKKYFLIVSDIFKSFLESGLEDKISIYQSMTQNGHLTENCVTWMAYYSVIIIDILLVKVEAVSSSLKPLR